MKRRFLPESVLGDKGEAPSLVFSRAPGQEVKPMNLLSYAVHLYFKDRERSLFRSFLALCFRFVFLGRI